MFQNYVGQPNLRIFVGQHFTIGTDVSILEKSLLFLPKKRSITSIGCQKKLVKPGCEKEKKKKLAVAILLIPSTEKGSLLNNQQSGL